MMVYANASFTSNEDDILQVLLTQPTGQTQERLAMSYWSGRELLFRFSNVVLNSCFNKRSVSRSQLTGVVRFDSSE
jgi:hypothetical protein